MVVFNLRFTEIDAAVAMWTRFILKLQVDLFRQIKGTLANLLAEDKGEVVLSFFLVAQVLETQSFQEADQTLIIYGKLIPCHKEDKMLNICILF